MTELLARFEGPGGVTVNAVRDSRSNVLIEVSTNRDSVTLAPPVGGTLIDLSAPGTDGVLGLVDTINQAARSSGSAPRSHNAISALLAAVILNQSQAAWLTSNFAGTRTSAQATAFKAVVDAFLGVLEGWTESHGWGNAERARAETLKTAATAYDTAIGG